MRTGLEAVCDQVLEELQKVAFASFGDVADMVDVENWLSGVPVSELPAVASTRIKTTGTGTEREIRMYDKLKALEMLAKILGMYSDGLRTGDVPKIIDDIQRRLKGDEA